MAFCHHNVMDKRINKRLLAYFSFLFSFLFAIPVQATMFENGFEYIYSLSKNDFTVANVNLKLDVALNKLTYTSHAYPVGFASLFVSDTITEQSIITHNNNTLKPQSYSYIKKSADKLKEQFHIKFDWQNNTAIDNRVTKPFTLTSSTFDTLSFQLALAKAISVNSSKLTFSFLDHKKLKTYTLNVQGKELLETDAGKFNTVKLEYFDEVKKRQVFIWCAQQLDYLPIQIKRIDEDGDFGTLKLLSLKPRTEPDIDENSNDF